MIEGAEFYPQSPDFDAQEKHCREAIKLRERLAESTWRVMPCFIHQTAIDRMGLENVGTVLEQFHGALRDFLCEGVEYHLAQMLKQREHGSSWKPPKPSVEDLMAAQLQVQRLEEAVAAMDQLSEKENYAFGAAMAMMRPLTEVQLDEAKRRLTYIQTRMEESDEAAESPMSNAPQPGEVENSDEAKEK